MHNDIPVPSDLQRALLDEITDVLKDLVSTNAAGELVTGYTGYPQFLPVLVNDDDTADQFFPYFIVRLDTGKAVSVEDPWTVTVDILLGVHDAGTNNEGHYHILNAITRIVNRFAEEPTIGAPGHKAFRALPEMEWGLQDEDTWPYFFGGVEIKFLVPKPGIKEITYDHYQEMYI